MKVRVKTYCGCCDLHTGTLMVGIGGIFFSIGGITTHSTGGLESIEDEDYREEVEFGIGYSYFYILINALLIYGAIKESRYFLLPWLIYVAIGLGVLTGCCLLTIAFLPQIVIIISLICAALWYVWICVLSYYHELNPINPLLKNIISDVTQVTTMAPTVVTYAPQPPEYTEFEKGPRAV